MPADFGVRLTSALRGSALVLDDGVWEVYVFGVSHVHGDWFVHTAAIGPRTQTVTVRVGRGHGAEATADRVLATIRDCLLTRTGGEHAFVTLAP